MAVCSITNTSGLFNKNITFLIKKLATKTPRRKEKIERITGFLATEGTEDSELWLAQI